MNHRMHDARVAIKHNIKYFFANFGYCVKPRFLIIGTQKGGTTSLFNYLAQHPLLVPSRTSKEVDFFSNETNYAKGYSWYHAQFPYPYKTKRHSLAFEATPEYLYYPFCAERIRAYNPNMKLIIVLRDPVARAYSAWNMYRGFQENKPLVHLAEYREFERAVREEIELMNRPGDAPLEPSYVRRGLYALQIERYLSFFPADRIYIAENKELKSDTIRVLNEITAFLGMPEWNWADARLPVLNIWKYENPISPGIRSFLAEYYKPHNERLFRLIGKAYNWS